MPGRHVWFQADFREQPEQAHARRPDRRLRDLRCLQGFILSPAPASSKTGGGKIRGPIGSWPCAGSPCRTPQRRGGPLQSGSPGRAASPRLGTLAPGRRTRPAGPKRQVVPRSRARGDQPGPGCRFESRSWLCSAWRSGRRAMSRRSPGSGPAAASRVDPPGHAQVAKRGARSRGKPLRQAIQVAKQPGAIGGRPRE